MPSSIYQITNQVNGKRYIGSAENLKRRWREHLAALRRGQHHNKHLQSAFRKYGRDAFAFSLLENTKLEMLIECEQHYLDTLQPEYNIAPMAGSQRGFRHTIETRRRIGQAQVGGHHTPERRRKNSESHMGHPVSEEARKKISLALGGDRHPNYGKRLSVETRAKLSAAWTPERRQARSDELRGRLLSEEHKHKISMTWTRERRQKQSDKMRGMAGQRIRAGLRMPGAM